MKNIHKNIAGAAILVGALFAGIALAQTPTVTKWNDTVEKLPVVTPGATDADAPSDAVVLFDGESLAAWENVKGGTPVQWKVEDGYMEVVAGPGDIRTKEKFGSCQLHIEWAAPEAVVSESQGRGNSGVFLMTFYEVQILDNYENDTYAIGYAGAVYGQSPPLANVCRKPGKWQTYDIVFHAPQFEGERCVEPATITVLHNGVLIQDHFSIQGAAAWAKEAEYAPHPDRLPILLQSRSPVRYRNIWLRPLDD